MMQCIEINGLAQKETRSLMDPCVHWTLLYLIVFMHRTMLLKSEQFAAEITIAVFARVGQPMLDLFLYHFFSFFCSSIPFFYFYVIFPICCKSQLCPCDFDKLNSFNLGKRNYLPQCFSVGFAYENLFVDQLLSTALRATTEAVVQRCSVKKVFFEISQN